MGNFSTGFLEKKHFGSEESKGPSPFHFHVCERKRQVRRRMLSKESASKKSKNPEEKTFRRPPRRETVSGMNDRGKGGFL